MPSSPEPPPLDRLVAWFETLTPGTVPELRRLYAADARFKDPFNEVQGAAAIERIFAHMFVVLQEPRFAIRDRVASGDQAFLTWDFDFRVRGRALRVHGATHLRFDAAGRVTLHRDYWDAAEELYAKLPGIGAVVRWLGRRLATP